MNWSNKELDRLVREAGEGRVTDPLLVAAHIRLAYALGKSDGRTEGILSMAPSGAHTTPERAGG